MSGLVYAGVEGGGTTFVVAIAKDDPTNIVERAEFPTTTPQETLQKCCDWLKKRYYDALGVATFGPVELHCESKHYGYITNTPKPGWKYVDVLGPLRAIRPDVPFGFDTDVNAPAMAEHAHLYSQAVKEGIPPPSSCCYVTVGTGVGVGMVVNNQPVHGLMHSEAGHMAVPLHPTDAETKFVGDNPKDCFAGVCVENMACSGALAKRAGLAKATAIKDLPDNHEVWDILAFYLGALCANVMLLGSPEKIILSGGVMQRSSLFPRVRKEMLKHLNSYLHSDLLQQPGVERLVGPSTWGNKAGIIGALTLGQAAFEQTTPRDANNAPALSLPVHKRPDAPQYPRDISAYPNVIAHIGVGGFMRSHQAFYLHELLSKGLAKGWAYCGIGLMSSDSTMAKALRSQDYLYTALSQGPRGSKATIIGSIMDFKMVPEDPAAVVEFLASSQVKIVSLTITEKGYCMGVDGSINTQNPLIMSELTLDWTPKSAPGLMFAALALRLKNGVKPFSVMSCDNMPGNGNVAKKALLQFARARAELGDPAGVRVAELIETSRVAFPCTMVDRITPVTVASHKSLLSQEFKIDDAWPVVCEDFHQWVVEDDFPLGRPAWQSVGALIVSVDKGIDSYEAMKLRLLNGAHSAMSYISYLAGHRLVHEAMADPAVRRFVQTYLNEVVVTVPAVDGINLEKYRSTLIERFSNIHVGDTLLRLAEDGCLKLQNTMRDVLLEQMAARRDFSTMALAIAGWIRFMAGTDESGIIITGIRDPKAARFKELALNVLAQPDVTTVADFLAEVFGEEVSSNPVANSAVAAEVMYILRNGTRKALQDRFGKRRTYDIPTISSYLACAASVIGVALFAVRAVRT